MPFAVAAAGVGVAGSVIGSAMQSSAISDAQDKANAEQQRALDQARTDLAPYTAVGPQALSLVSDLSGLNGAPAAQNAMASNFVQSPGYQYQLQQGLSAVDNGAAAKGLLRSGNTLRAEQELGNNLASQDYGSYINRLSSILSTGYNATAAQNGMSIQTAKDIATTDASAGKQQAGIIGSGFSGAENSIIGGLKDYYGLNYKPDPNVGGSPYTSSAYTQTSGGSP